MNKYCFIILLVLLFVTSSPGAQNTQQQKDSLRNIIPRLEGKDKLTAYVSLTGLYINEVGDQAKMDTLFMLYDEMEAEAISQGARGRLGLVYGNRIIAYRNKLMYDEVIRLAPDALKFYEENEFWIYYYQIYAQLINAYNQTKDYEKAIEEAEIMYNMARRQNDQAGIASALFATANIYNLQGRHVDQEKCLRECIDLLWQTPHYDGMLTSAYAFLCISLRAQKRYEEIFKVIPDFEKAIENSPQHIRKVARQNLYIALMNNYVDTGDYEKADNYLKKIENPQINETVKCDILRASALIHLSRKEYRQALIQIDSAIEISSHAEYNSNLSRKIKVMVLAQMGDTGNALSLFEDVLDANAAIHDTEVNVRFEELRTQYEVDKHIAEKKRNRNYFLFAVGCCMMLVLLLGIAVSYNRIVSRKNRNLYRRIKEQDRLEQELASLTIVSESETGNPDITNMPGDRNQRELVNRLKTYILSERKHTEADMGRDEFISALGTNRNTLSEAVKAVTGKTFMEYVRFLQLEEARRKLENHPELTVEAIAFDLSFTTLSTFYRQFRKHYGISPAEYRKISDSMRG